MTDKIKLHPCPFCGEALQINQRKHNPFARCATAGCVGGKLPLLNIELAEDVEAWNRRAAIAQQPAQAVPDGYALVPIKPTYEMTVAYNVWGTDYPKDPLLKGPPRNLDHGAYSAMLAAAPAAPASDRLEKLLAEEERSNDLTMRQRDRAEEMATELAEAIGEYFGCDVGEHSSGNCPWENALGVLHAAPQEPVAWQDPDNLDRICSARTMLEAKRTGGATLSALKPLTRPLYAAPPAAEQPFRMLSAEEIAVRELLAAMNRDGGQHQHSVGIAQAAKDALTEFSRLQQTLAEQPDAVKVPRKVLENWLDSADERERPRFVHVLRALLAGGAE